MAVDISGIRCYDTPDYSNVVYYQYGGCQGRQYVLMEAGTLDALISAAGDGSGGAASAPAQFTADEVTALKYQAANPSPFNLSFGDGALIAIAVLAVWAIAVGWKQLAALFSGGNSSE